MNEDVESEKPKIKPTIAVKMLRDHIDSANALANFGTDPGLFSYNFFDGDLVSNINAERPAKLLILSHKLKEATDFTRTVGHFDFAKFEQDGTEVDEPQFPFQLRYEPTGDINFPADTYDITLFEQFSKIEAESVLYKVFAMDKPNGTEKHIANVVLEGQLVTSKWADEKMFFRHGRMDDDLRYHPEWAAPGNMNTFLVPSDVGVAKIRPPS